MRNAPPSRTFGWEAQDLFAEFSGDRNPMHMDAVAARRTHGGQPVVHGMHAILWALETLSAAGQLHQPVARIKVRFQKLTYVGDTVTLQVARRDAAGTELHLCIDDVPVTTLTIAFGGPQPIAAGQNSSDAIPAASWPDRAMEYALTDLEGRSGWVAFARDPEAARQSFPALSGNIGPRRVSALACMSRLVGMVCPGLHSTFFSLTLDTVEPSAAPDAIHYRVTTLHEQFRLVKQSIEGGGWSGLIDSLARVPPIAQASMENLAGLVRNSEFDGSNALIIGGSRGLGELTAKLVAAGGGAVTITYAVGRDDAEDVGRQIREWGGSCEVMQYDASLPAAEQLAGSGKAFTSLYYFATTSIFLRKTKIYSRATFETFLRIYVDGFYDICEVFHDAKPGFSAFYPSSVAVEDRPIDMTEYAMAKAAGEILCTDLARRKKGLRFIVERLPRLLTDQTATVMPTKNIAPHEVMLPIVRRVEGRHDP
jgi:hypothetical protein